MRSNVRFALLAPLVGAILALVAVSAPAAQAAFGVETFVAANCSTGHETCGEEKVGTYSFPKEPSKAEAETQGYTQAGGHPAVGITAFKVNTEGTLPNEVPSEGKLVEHIRTDVSPGVSTNPEAVSKCTMEEFGETEVAPGSGFYPEPQCAADTEIGLNTVVVVVEPSKGVFEDVPLEGKVYNLVQPEGRASDFGVALNLASIGVPYYAHTMIEGGVEWGAEANGTGKADYHDYYEINVSTALPLISSRLALVGDIGNTGNGGFITNPSNCAGPGLATTNTVTLTSTASEVKPKTYTAPIGTEGCKGESGFLVPPFVPTFGLTPGAGETQSDQPDGITAELTVPHNPLPSELDSSQLRTASVTLPEGMTLNPSAASGLKACSPTQIGIKTRNAVTCPAASKLGEVTLTVPDLPASEPLTGSIYLGGTEPITGGSNPNAPEYTIYLNAESARYGVDVRLEGKVTPSPTTGRVTTTFSENPEQPFSNIKLKFNGGSLAPIANPLVCGTATATTSLVPYIGSFATAAPSSAFVVDSNGKGGACPSPLPFALTQSTQNQNANAGGSTSFTFSLSRPEGQQYLSQVKTTLPPGLVALLPTVTPCGEEQANAGTCPASSLVGAAAALAGSGPTPFLFTGGTVYLTGPYNGAPYGLSIVVPAVAGPFSLGNVVTRATINVDPHTARVIVTSVLPTIHAGVPLRLRGITVAINKQGYLINPTNCSAFLTESTLTSTFGTAQTGLNSPFQVNACGALAFKPSFKAKTSAKTSKANGASLETTLNIGAGQTNYKSVMVQLPKQLPSRLTTLQKACPESVFNTNPFKCPSGSFVGGARANTPTLSGKLQGPAILVSHAGLAFPDLDLVMEANGVKVIVVGNTKISKGITTTTFASTPDVPVSSITVNLPIGGHSALTANGNLCTNPLTMPTTLIGQNGFKVTQKTKITVASCSVRIAGKKVIGNTAYITVQTFSAGRISGSGGNLKTVYRKLGKAQKTATLKVPLSNKGRRKGRPLKVKLRVGFVPKTKSIGNSASTTTVVFG
ncbi:MAG TPA: hypothetical protein VGL54_08535 [Solirubrobacteraceae bacterium]|jgi:hypothetical protein